MTAKIVPVIMAGGKGTRLWPLSRASAPKQFLSILNDESLFQKTLVRVSDATRYEPAIIVTNAEFRFLVAEQAREAGVPLARIILEPIARNTAAALAAAAAVIIRDFGSDTLMQVLASDHEIDAGSVYFTCIDHAAEAARAGKLVTFGITPTEPATGFGYVERGEPLTDGAYTVKRFVEKPDADRAEEMIATGRFSWNSGMFMVPVQQFMDELREFAPLVYDSAVKAVEKSRHDLDFDRLDEAAFSQSPDISIDFALFEKTANAAVVPSSFAWSDLGSWDAVWKQGDKDPQGNVAIGQTTLNDTQNSLVLSKDIHVAVQGLSDVAVIASDDAVYVGRLSDSQLVGKVVKRLAADKTTATLTTVHRTAYRPWGAQTALLEGDRFELKRLILAPGKKISLQKHYHRAEHWIVVRGTAEITIGGETQLLCENESMFIPQGEQHQLSNPGKMPLEVIEVRTGSYFGEDDIVRVGNGMAVGEFE
ncbi:mannose-1-phosphate guanylyltransferase/mannose-6-phosphate isomerase [Rhizobium sp. CFBP 8762]|uniref:mannose-1-phosphate guanylyltransferase/mannose-6-phosphate isomerase n=1 Tax=Rhizobium sp. CFBP 8762 TaxID=2775279 RepID=UPI001780DB9F|nr:mannose-1-phosphate guanylyltransferase/mannose-6-phosphate isomerase [Rhizobium sp. CFBP 8762]MBD8555513.1 mannose-1-phosphate guanylyltransferase/mannose-6-phosphate isomerase [Rhizobium sp. CFBP 8762]